MTCFQEINGRRVKVTCEGARRPPDELKAVVETEAQKRGMLAGDLIAAMTKAIGIPPCDGCEKRRQWLNRAHAWLLGKAAEPPQGPAG